MVQKFKVKIGKQKSLHRKKKPTMNNRPTKLHTKNTYIFKIKTMLSGHSTSESFAINFLYFLNICSCAIVFRF